MSLDPIDNAASRLYKFLKFMKEYEPQRPGATTLLVPVTHYFKPDATRTGGMTAPMLRNIAALMELPLRMRSEIGALTSAAAPPEVLLRGVSEANRALRLLPNANHEAFAQFTGHYDEVHLLSIEMAAYTIAQERKKPSLEREALDEIQRLAREVMDLCEADHDMDETAKSYIWSHAVRIWRAAEEARAAGSGVILQAADEAVGHLLRSTEVQSGIGKGSATIEKFFTMLGRITIIMNLAYTPIALTADVTDLLELSQGPSSVQEQNSDPSGGEDVYIGIPEDAPEDILEEPAAAEKK